MQRLDNPAVRRLFLAAHALAEPPSGPATGEALAALIRRLGFVQVDSIATVERAHHMILWSRRQSYRPAALAPLIEARRQMWEHWTHDASILPVEHFPHWKHRFARSEARMRENWAKWFRPGYEDQLDTILSRIRDEGPLRAAEVGDEEPRTNGGWWDWHPSKTALEWLWRTGALSITRREGFHKVYDLTERVIPAALRQHEVALDDSIDWACRAALDRLGFATSGELAAFWHLASPDEARDWARAALRRGEVVEVQIEGAEGQWRKVLAWHDIAARLTAAPEAPRRLRILSPFDPALRDRKRAEFIFGFHYRIEVFVPEPQRRFGYYVFPVLEGDRLIGRLDAKAFRADGALRLRAFWPEPGQALTTRRRAALEAELGRLARFAGCERVVWLEGWQRETLGPFGGSEGAGA